MHLIDPRALARRAFLKRSAQLAVTGAALPTVLNLAAMGEAAAFSATGYKALVCVFLEGGNDSYNTVVPYDTTSYDRYSLARGGRVDRTGGGIALARSALASTVLGPATALPGGLQYALHPEMTALAGLFNAGRAAVLLNVGPLVVPLTRAQYEGSNRALYPIPPQLFSHNDQQSVWQSSSPEGASAGWGGNIGDLALSSNGTNSMLTCISVTGNAVFLTGDDALAYKVNTLGAVKIGAVTSNVFNSSAVRQAMSTLVQQTRGDSIEEEYNRVTRRAIAQEAVVSAGLGSGDGLGTGPKFASFAALPADNALASQLKLVARLIAARASFGVTRQVFFVSMGGFDFHDKQIADQAKALRKVSDALSAFYETTAQLGVAGQVTAFTASDFGRTLTSNGDGTDHGWGGHQFIVGGAVQGQRFVGTPPPISKDDGGGTENQSHVGFGRLLPSTSVDSYAATLARWFGVQGTELNAILPNLRNFGTVGGADDPSTLGFL